MNKWIERALSRTEKPPASEPELSGHGFTEAELATLRTIFRATIAEGHTLHRCDSPERARCWSDFLNQHLPVGRECFVIRGREVNSYSVTLSREN